MLSSGVKVLERTQFSKFDSDEWGCLIEKAYKFWRHKILQKKPMKNHFFFLYEQWTLMMNIWMSWKYALSITDSLFSNGCLPWYVWRIIQYDCIYLAQDFAHFFPFEFSMFVVCRFKSILNDQMTENDTNIELRRYPKRVAATILSRLFYFLLIVRSIYIYLFWHECKSWDIFVYRLWISQFHQAAIVLICIRPFTA